MNRTLSLLLPNLCKLAKEIYDSPKDKPAAPKMSAAVFISPNELTMSSADQDTTMRLMETFYNDLKLPLKDAILDNGAIFLYRNLVDHSYRLLDEFSKPDTHCSVEIALKLETGNVYGPLKTDIKQFIITPAGNDIISRENRFAHTLDVYRMFKARQEKL